MMIQMVHFVSPNLHKEFMGNSMEYGAKMDQTFACWIWKVSWFWCTWMIRPSLISGDIQGVKKRKRNIPVMRFVLECLAAIAYISAVQPAAMAGSKHQKSEAVLQVTCWHRGQGNLRCHRCHRVVTCVKRVTWPVLWSPSLLKVASSNQSCKESTIDIHTVHTIHLILDMKVSYTSVP